MAAVRARSGRNVIHSLVALWALSQSGCSLLLDTSAQQCSDDSDCHARGGPFANATCSNHVCVAHSTTTTTAGNGGAGGGGSGGGGGSTGDAGDPDAPTDPIWGCLGHVTLPPAMGTTAEVDLPFFDLINMVPLTGVGIMVCPKLDVTCQRPIDNRIFPADAQGHAHFTVPQFFNGFGIVYDLTSDAGTDPADGGDGGPNPTAGRFIPSIVFFNPPILNKTNFGIVPLFSRDDIDKLAAAQGNTWDQNFGMLFAGMLDCSRKPAAGVTWDVSMVDMKSKRFFYVNGFPDEHALATDNTGFGGLLNAPPGTIAVTASVQTTGKPVGTANVLVRAGWASYTYLAPTP
jgi:hypothetical protein